MKNLALFLLFLVGAAPVQAQVLSKIAAKALTKKKLIYLR